MRVFKRFQSTLIQLVKALLDHEQQTVLQKSALSKQTERPFVICRVECDLNGASVSITITCLLVFLPVTSVTRYIALH